MQVESLAYFREMNRYFIEVSYNGKPYAGFQIQENANTVQKEVETALYTFFRKPFFLTGSSRTDTGVHALQNYFHFDSEDILLSSAIYNLNSILPDSIVIKNILAANAAAHCRFDALSREYTYFIYQQKDPFLKDIAFYYPYNLKIDLLQEAAEIVKRHTDFTSFSKRSTQVKTFECTIQQSRWRFKDNCIIYNVISNRFLRGMVRGLVATMLQVGRGNISTLDFEDIILAKDPSKANFAVPGHGLFLVKVKYPDAYFLQG